MEIGLRNTNTDATKMKTLFIVLPTANVTG
jgi:hypothetical protein